MNLFDMQDKAWLEAVGEKLEARGVPEELNEIDLSSRIDIIVARCSHYSGWDLSWRWTEYGSIEIRDAKATSTEHYSIEQACKNHATLVVALYEDSDICLREVYGRLRQWNIGFLEQAFLAEALKRRRRNR